MPVSVVDINLSAEIAALPTEIFTDVAVIGTASSSPPNASFGEVNRYQSADEVKNDYSDGSDVHEASKAVEAEGAEYWYAIVLEETETTETLDGASGGLSNTPALGNPTPTAASGSLAFSTEDPVDIANHSEDSVLNTDTGDFDTSLTNDDITYSYVDWTPLQKLADQGIDRIHMANRKARREHIGTYDELAAWVSANEAGLVLPMANGSTYADEQAARQAANAIAGYVPSGDVIAVAHKSGDEVGGRLLGKLAVNDPWYNPFYDGDGFGVSTDYYEKSRVGDPGTTQTFEGGDSNGDGPVNVLINVGGTTVLSNSLSTAGASSNYQYFDVAMTETYAASIVENALTSLRLREDRVPFTADGRTMISSTIKDAFAGVTGGVDDPFANVTVNVPSIDQLSDSDKANRRWTGITIEGTLAGDVHEFGLELTVSV